MELTTISLGETEQDICGIIMPIANSSPYPDGHWGDVYNVLCESASMAGLKPSMVSFDEDVTVLHKRIIRNIYFNPIIICDISSKNSNVMFELGMRLAFDKPTIIVKDDKTPSSFDISSIEYLEYPSDLRYQLIVTFKEKLKNKILETLKRSTEDSEYSTFLKNFGDFKTTKIEEKEVGVNELLMDELKEIKLNLRSQSAVIKSLQSNGDEQIEKHLTSHNYMFSIPPTTKNITKIEEFLSSSPYNAEVISGHNKNSVRISFAPPITRNEANLLNKELLEFIK